MASVFPLWFAPRGQAESKTQTTTVETQNIEEGGFHLVELHLPINMDGGMMWLFIAILVAVGAYLYRKNIKKHADKKAFYRSGGNPEEFRDYRQWLDRGQPTRPVRSAHQPQQLSAEALIPLLQTLAARPALTTTAEIHELPASSDRPTASPAAFSPGLSDPVSRRENWHDQ